MNVTKCYDTKNAKTQEQAGLRDVGGKYLTFRLAGEEYGLRILKVREINGIMNITTVPRMPNFMKGVINLRGKVIPVIDLRSKFELPEKEYTDQTCVIVVDVGREIGVIVDTVSEVLDIAAENIEPPPAMGLDLQRNFILGIGKVGDEVKILLNIDNVLSQNEMVALSAGMNAAAESPPPEEPSR